MELTAQSPITEAIAHALVGGGIPVEFTAGPESLFINEADAPDWAKVIFTAARTQLADHIADGGSPDKKESPDTYRFEMNRNFPLTQSMGDAGWTQWQSTVQTKSKEDCAAEGVKYKKYRYAVHFWVSPDGELALGKLKTQGKFIPC